MSKFYVGQKVRDEAFMPGLFGIVEHITPKETHVCFNGVERRIYSQEGVWGQAKIVTLISYDDEWHIIHKPAVKFEKWERVLVRDGVDRPWVARVFMFEHKEFINMKYCTGSGIGEHWTYCRKWDENLVGKVTED